jgi:hypothetical protein
MDERSIHIPCTAFLCAMSMMVLLLQCYILILPPLFLIPPHLLTHLPMKSLIVGTVLPLSPNSLILFPLIPLISSPVWPLSQLTLAPCYIPGPIPLIALLSSTLIVLTETLQSFGSWPRLIRLIGILWNTLAFAMNTSALLTTLMVVTDWLSSYLLISSSSSPRISYCSLVLIAPLCFSLPLMGLLLFLV